MKTTKPYVVTNLSRNDAFYSIRKQFIGKPVSERMLKKMHLRRNNSYYGNLFGHYFYSIKIEKVK